MQNAYNVHLYKLCLLVIVVLGSIFFAHAVFAATITVTTTEIGIIAEGDCSLAEAIQNANSDAVVSADCAAGSGTDTIEFNIAGGSTADQVLTNSTGTVVPEISTPININGLSQGDATCGTANDLSDRDLDIRISNESLYFVSGSAGSSIRGISTILNLGSTESELYFSETSSITVSCSHIGVDETGLIAQPLRNYPVSIDDTSDIVIGGASLVDGNIIAGGNAESFHEGVLIADANNVTVQNNRLGVGAGPTNPTFLPAAELVEVCGPTDCGGLASAASTNISIIDNILPDDFGSTSDTDVFAFSGVIGGRIEGHVIQGGEIGVRLVATQNITVHDNDISNQDNGQGIILFGSDSTTITGNTFESSGAGIAILNSDTTTIGAVGIANRNIISGHNDQAIVNSASSNTTIINNYIGTDETGLISNSNINPSTGFFNATVLISGNSDNIIIGGTGAGEENIFSTDSPLSVNADIALSFDPVGGDFDIPSNITIQGNHFGLGPDNTTTLPVGTTSVLVYGVGDDVLVGGINADEGNIFNGSDDPDTLGAVAAIGIVGNPNGVAVDGLSILRNQISGYEDGPAINLIIDSDGDFNPDDLFGPNVNDIGDADTAGPNDLLNYPVIYDASDNGNGTTTVNYFLDVPAGDYRIEFFENSRVPSLLHGEGETFLDADTITHTGSGVELFSHTLNVSSGDIITSTNTEVDAGSAWGFGRTSEFGNTVTVEALGADFGDAPNSYSTNANSNGAYHLINTSVYLGECVDADGVAVGGNSAATLDDSSVTSPTGGTCDNLGDDEDGVSFPGILDWDASVDLVIEASVAGELNAWIDYNADGDWDDAGEQIADDLALTTGNNTLTTTIASGSGYVQTYARFRFNTADINGASYDLTPQGESLDGEVEDYRIFLGRQSRGGGGGGGNVVENCYDEEATNFKPEGKRNDTLCEYDFDLEILTPTSEEETEPEVDTNPTSGGGDDMPTLSTDTCPYFTTYLRRGDSGKEVARLQDFLNKYLNLSLVVDGDFGPSTKRAVQQFQNQHADDILRPWNITATGWFYKTSLGTANEIVGCEQEEVFLERVNILHRFNNERLFNIFRI